ncbi:MAG TPA: hypothetical protein VE397_19745 [Stellaceae bacterium]|jgi:hypothetical protein|nr:hypothetical protein [Stellaceae bacterium]
MRRLPMLAVTVTVLLSLTAVAAAADADKAPPAGGTFAEIGTWFDRGVHRVADAASDLWAAGKAAVNAGAETLQQRETAREEGRNPDLAGK